ncbi:hypothetical protein RBE51_19085 [Pseudomonas taiwanensis]|uniref:hypothetical protein n=1 Tax=Pseudomonas taiwanensis TaxID=470150 RepID=UPI0028DEA635|nr:hypothetical protein [Pseudomonas taiwanensis]MDT8924895.1 hypothetical protein [Pseudomonas taiwanensis]
MSFPYYWVYQLLSTGLSMTPSTDAVSAQKIIEYVKGLPAKDRQLMEGVFSRTEGFFDNLGLDDIGLISTHLRLLGLTKPPVEQTDEQRIEMWGRYGLTVAVPAGRARFSGSMMLAPHDGVPYCVDEDTHYAKTGSDDRIRHAIGHRQMMIDCYHAKIKALYNYCLALERGPVWVLSGGGARVQAFFGYEQGYFANLCLDMQDVPRHTEEQRAELAGRTHSLTPNFEHHEPLFERLDIPGVKVTLHN